MDTMKALEKYFATLPMSVADFYDEHHMDVLPLGTVIEGFDAETVYRYTLVAANPDQDCWQGERDSWRSSVDRADAGKTYRGYIIISLPLKPWGFGER